MSKDDVRTYIQEQEEFLRKIKEDRRKVQDPTRYEVNKMARNFKDNYIDVTSSSSS
jgi:hypothetical protein